jgi:hypothetical protein
MALNTRRRPRSNNGSKINRLLIAEQSERCYIDFLMNHLCHARFCATVAAATVLVAAAGRAGEPIVIPAGKEKTPLSTVDKKLPSRDVFRFGDRLNNPSGFDVLTVPITPGITPLTSKEQKRRKLERLERQNWMVVGKGELQAEEEEKNFLNVRDYSLEGLEKEDSSSLMFRNLKKEDDQRQPGQLRSSTDPLRPRGQRPSEEEEEAKDNPRLQREEGEFGAHVSTDLKFNKLFEPRQESDSFTPKFNKSDLTLQRLLNGGRTPEAAREQKAQSDEFRAFLDNRGSAQPLVGASDPINFGSDFTRQPINPTTSQPLGGSTLGNGGRFGPVSTTLRPGSPLAGGLPNAFGGAPTPAGFSSGPLLAPRSEPVRPTKQMTFEPPRRKF